MFTIQEIKAKFPEAHSVGGELVVRIGNETVVLAGLGNNSLNLTKKGQELMGEPQVKMTAEVKAEVRKPKAKKAETPPVENDSLDDILAE